MGGGWITFRDFFRQKGEDALRKQMCLEAKNEELGSRTPDTGMRSHRSTRSRGSELNETLQPNRKLNLSAEASRNKNKVMLNNTEERDKQED